MKKLALFVALAMIAASPAMAAQKKAKKSAEPAMTPEQQVNDASYRLARDSLPIFLPSWAQAVYQVGIKPNQDAAAAPTKSAKQKARSAKAKTM